MASSPFSTISLRARSWRSCRSSRVIGWASVLRDFNRAIEGGREVSSAGAASPKDGVARAPAETPPTARNRRREIIILLAWEGTETRRTQTADLPLPCLSDSVVNRHYRGVDTASQVAEGSASEKMRYSLFNNGIRLPMCCLWRVE